MQNNSEQTNIIIYVSIKVSLNYLTSFQICIYNCVFSTLNLTIPYIPVQCLLFILDL